MPIPWTAVTCDAMSTSSANRTNTGSRPGQFLGSKVEVMRGRSTARRVSIPHRQLYIHQDFWILNSPSNKRTLPITSSLSN
jgi:hypothetical protein